MRVLRSQANRRAFSALELIAAIAIGLIVSVIGFSGFRIFHNEMPVKSVAQRISHSLSTARSFAVSRNGFFVFVFDIDRRSFWVSQVNDPAADTTSPTFIDRSRPKILTPEFVDRRVAIEGINIIPGGPIIGSGTQQIMFRPDGSADVDARLTFYDAERNPADSANVYTVRLYGPTGHNKLYPRQRI